MPDFLRRLRAANITRNAEYRAKTQGEELPLLFRTTEFAGEVGELLNVVKKIERERLGWTGKRADRKMLLEEFGGVVATLDLLAMALDVDLAAATADEFNAVSDRISLNTKLAATSAPPAMGGEPVPVGPVHKTTKRLLAHLKSMPMTEWVWSDAEMIFDALKAAIELSAPSTSTETGASVGVKERKAIAAWNTAEAKRWEAELAERRSWGGPTLGAEECLTAIKLHKDAAAAILSALASEGR